MLSEFFDWEPYWIILWSSWDYIFYFYQSFREINIDICLSSSPDLHGNFYLWIEFNFYNYHCGKSVRIWSFSGLYSGLFLVRTEYGHLKSKYPYSVQTKQNKDQKNYEYGHLLRSV